MRGLHNMNTYCYPSPYVDYEVELFLKDLEPKIDDGIYKLELDEIQDLISKVGGSL